jgi:hypothetical protein
VQELGPEEITTLIKRSEDFLKYGDVASARLSLRRAASAGNAQAALALGVTFDPAFLREAAFSASRPTWRRPAPGMRKRPSLDRATPRAVSSGWASRAIERDDFSSIVISLYLIPGA